MLVWALQSSEQHASVFMVPASQRVRWAALCPYEEGPRKREDAWWRRDPTSDGLPWMFGTRVSRFGISWSWFSFDPACTANGKYCIILTDRHGGDETNIFHDPIIVIPEELIYHDWGKPSPQSKWKACQGPGCDWTQGTTWHSSHRLPQEGHSQVPAGVLASIPWSHLHGLA